MKKMIMVGMCIGYVVFLLYRYVHLQNEITQLQLEIPKLAKELHILEQRNRELQFCIDQFYNPLHLMELADTPAYSYLKHPLLKEVTELELYE